MSDDINCGANDGAKLDTPPEVSRAEERARAALDQKLADAAARTRMTARTVGAPLADAMPRLTRRGTCACGTAFDQLFVFEQWAPLTCDACHARENDAKLDTWHAEREAQRRTVALAALDVPLLYADATLDTFALVGDDADRKKQARVLQLARRYLGLWESRHAPDARLDFPHIAIFAGGPGTGKGHIAWALARAVTVEFAELVKFTVLSDCVRDLREAWTQARGQGPSEAARLAGYRTPALLVIDEVSEHAFHGQTSQHLYDLVAWREQRLLPTILTTNEPPEKLGELLGDALVSRARGWGGVWEFGTLDYRIERRKLRKAARTERQAGAA